MYAVKQEFKKNNFKVKSRCGRVVRAIVDPKKGPCYVFSVIKLTIPEFARRRFKYATYLEVALRVHPQYLTAETRIYWLQQHRCKAKCILGPSSLCLRQHSEDLSSWHTVQTVSF